MGFLRALGAASLLAAGVQAAVSSTGFTVSLTDIDYFLPPKPVASIAGCEEIKASFENGLFVPFTVVKDSLTASFAEDDVWQEGFGECTCLYPLTTIPHAKLDQIFTSKETARQATPLPPFSLVPLLASSHQDPISSALLAKSTRPGDYSLMSKELSLSPLLLMEMDRTRSCQPARLDRSLRLRSHLACTLPRRLKSPWLVFALVSRISTTSKDYERPMATEPGIGSILLLPTLPRPCRT